ncbi:MAG: DUF2252 family protein, partial [Zoogloea sp.]|nr:DUF2252 family protein [Zoogloea sp.]
ARLKEERTEEAKDRLDNLRELLAALDDFEQTGEEKGLSAFLEAVEMAGRPFVLKELLPSQDRVELRGAAQNLKHCGRLLADFAAVTAWGQLRAAGRRGAAGVESLMAFAEDAGWQDELLRIAADMAEQVRADWVCFRDALAAGLDEAGGAHQ